MKNVYLAGPMVFWQNIDETFERMKLILNKYDLHGVAPIDNQECLKGVPPGPQLNRKIYSADIEIMNNVDAAIFNITPFRRGTEMDTGTAFEIGYCAARGLPMTGWTTDNRTYPELVDDFFKDVYVDHLQSTALASTDSKGASSGLRRDPDGIMIHSAGLHQNLMVQVAIENSGALIEFDPEWETAFENAAVSLSTIIYAEKRTLTK